MVHGVHKWTQGIQCQQMCSDQPPSVQIKAQDQHEDTNGGTSSSSLIWSEQLLLQTSSSASQSQRCDLCTAGEGQLARRKYFNMCHL